MTEITLSEILEHFSKPKTFSEGKTDKDNCPTDSVPHQEKKSFYESLPFQGLKTAPKKVIATNLLTHSSIGNC